MQKIKLRNQNEEVLIDDEDFEELSKYRWHGLSNGQGHVSAIHNKKKRKLI